MFLGPLLLVSLAVVVAGFVVAVSTLRPLDERPLSQRAVDLAAAWRSPEARRSLREQRVRETFDRPRPVSLVQLLDESPADDGRAYVEVDEMVSDMHRVLPVAQVAQISERIRAMRPTRAAASA